MSIYKVLCWFRRWLLLSEVACSKNIKNLKQVVWVILAALMFLFPTSRWESFCFLGWTQGKKMVKGLKVVWFTGLMKFLRHQVSWVVSPSPRCTSKLMNDCWTADWTCTDHISGGRGPGGRWPRRSCRERERHGSECTATSNAQCRQGPVFCYLPTLSVFIGEAKCASQNGRLNMYSQYEVLYSQQTKMGIHHLEIILLKQ